MIYSYSLHRPTLLATRGNGMFPQFPISASAKPHFWRLRCGVIQEFTVFASGGSVVKKLGVRPFPSLPMSLLFPIGLVCLPQSTLKSGEQGCGQKFVLGV